MAVIVKADEIKYEFDIQHINDSKETVKVICICNDIIYFKTISPFEEWWSNNKKYFQDSFEGFLKIIKSALIENDQSFNVGITPEYLDKLNVIIQYNSPFFNFEISIDVKREPTLEEKFDELGKHFKTLKDRFTLIEIENTNLRNKVDKLEKELDDGWQLFSHKNCCTKTEQYVKVLPFTSLESAKISCIAAGYCVFVLWRGEVYFRKCSYQECIEDVNLIHDDDSECMTYIHISSEEEIVQNAQKVIINAGVTDDY